MMEKDKDYSIKVMDRETLLSKKKRGRCYL